MKCKHKHERIHGEKINMKKIVSERKTAECDKNTFSIIFISSSLARNWNSWAPSTEQSLQLVPRFSWRKPIYISIHSENY